MVSFSSTRRRQMPLLLPLCLFLTPTLTLADHTCHGSGRIGDPLQFEDQIIPCSVLAMEEFAMLEYRFNLPVAVDFDRPVTANAYASASIVPVAGTGTGSSNGNGLSLQMTSMVGFPQDAFMQFSFLRKGACSDEEVWRLFANTNTTWTPRNLQTSITGSLPGEYARLYVGVSLNQDAVCEGNVSVAVSLQDAYDDYKFSSDCLEVDRCFGAPTPAPTFASPDPPNTTFCDFDPTYSPSNLHSGPLPGKSTYTPLEVDCPAVNETVLVWFDVQLPTTNTNTFFGETMSKISLAVSTGYMFHQTDGIDFHGWHVSTIDDDDTYASTSDCVLPDRNTQSINEATLDNTWCPPELRSKLCYDERIRGISGSIQRVFGALTNNGGCQGSLQLEATLVDGTIDDNGVDLTVFEYTSCSSPLAICEEGDELPPLPQPTPAPTPATPEFCTASKGTLLMEPITVDCPPVGEFATVVFDLHYNPGPNATNVGFDILTVVSYNNESNQTEGLKLFYEYDFEYDTDFGRFPEICDRVPFFDGEPEDSIVCPPEPSKLCTNLNVPSGASRYIRYSLGVLNEGGQCQDGQLLIEVAVEDPDMAVECHSALESCVSASAPTAAPTWFQPPPPASDVCEFNPEHNRYGKNYPNQGLSTFPSLVIPSSCNGTDDNSNSTTSALVWFDFRMPITGSNHHTAATQLEVAVTAMDDDRIEDLIVRFYMMPDFRQQQSMFTNSCDDIEDAFGSDFATGEVDNWLCDGVMEGPQTICRSASYNTYQGSVVRVFVSVESNTTGHCAGDLQFDATLSDISIATTDFPLELYEHSECIQAFTQCRPGETFPEMTTWDDAIPWDALGESESPSQTPSVTPSINLPTTVPSATPSLRPSPLMFLAIPAADLPQANDAAPSALLSDENEGLASSVSPPEEISFESSATKNSGMFLVGFIGSLLFVI